MGKGVGLCDKESGDRNDRGERGERRRRRRTRRQGRGVRGKNVEVELNVERVGRGQSERQGHVSISAHRDELTHNSSCGLLQLRNMAARSLSARFRG